MGDNKFKSTLLSRRETICPISAFSLVEVVLALGVVSFALLSLLGLMANGVAGLHQSMSTSTLAQLAQGLASEVQMLDYSDVTNSSSRFRQSFTPARYYDEEGQETSSATAATYAVTLATSNSQIPGVQSPAAGAANAAQQLRAQIINLHAAPPSATNNLCIWAINNGR